MDGFRLELTLRHYLLFAVVLFLLVFIGWVIAWVINKRTGFSFPISAAIGAVIVTIVLMFFLIVTPR
jgi:uncharacterized membrane protein YjjB (DUF3815 family)